MNENKSLKLHKSHKIVCFIVCLVIVLSMLTVSAFADEGVYNLNGLFNFRIPPSNMSGDVYNYDGTITFSPFTATFDFGGDSIEGTVRIIGANYLQISADKLVVITAQYQEWLATTIEIETEMGTQTLEVASIIFSSGGNTVSAVIDNSYTEIAFTGMPSTMRFNGMFTTTYIDTDFFIEYFGRIEEYDGNPWVDILNGVASALDVNIFGTFSYLDIVSTLAGACLAIWLLKMLAGG